MNNNPEKKLSDIINEGVQKAVIKAIDRHCKLGESIAVLQDEKTAILSSQKIEKNYQNLLSN